jgi:hypothetical protein
VISDLRSTCTLYRDRGWGWGWQADFYMTGTSFFFLLFSNGTESDRDKRKSGEMFVVLLVLGGEWKIR